MAVVNRIAPEHLELLTADPAGRWCRWSATPARSSAGRGRRPRWATTSPGRATCCRPTARPGSRAALTVRDFQKERARHHPRRGGAGQGRPARRRLADGRGARRARRHVASRRPARAVTVTRPHRAARRRRAHGGLPLAAGRRGRPAQHQRVADAAAGRRGASALADELADIEWHRYPDRAATELRARHRRAARRRARAGVRRQRLQRGAADAVAHLRRCRAARVAVFEPTYALHSHIARLTGTGVAVG